MPNVIAFLLASIALGFIVPATTAAELPAAGLPAAGKIAAGVRQPASTTGVAEVPGCTAAPEPEPPAPGAEIAWTISVPRNTFARQPGDLRGSLIRFGDRVYQIDRIQWQRTPDGTLMPAWIQGYNRRQESVRLSWPRPGGIEAALPGELSWSLLRLPGRIIVLRSSVLGTNREGFLVFRDAQGTDTGSGQAALLQDVAIPATYPCGITQEQSCRSRNCGASGCGDAPACTCSGNIGGCDVITRTWCEGSCDTIFRCNTSVVDCRCVRLAIPPEGGAGGTLGDKKAIDLQGTGPAPDPPGSE